MTNKEIREAAKAAHVPQWRIADKFGVADATFCRWMRHEFTPERKDQALHAIAEIAAEMAEEKADERI